MASNKNERDDHSINDTLDLLRDQLAKKQKVLDKREKDIAKAAEAFEKEKELFGSSSSKDRTDTDVLYLNVGGTVIQVLRRTITSVKGSMLASMFSGRWDDNVEKDKDGNFFIDQPYEPFMRLINYLRAKNCETPLGPPAIPPLLCDFNDSEEKYFEFLRIVEYFGVTPGVYPCVIRAHCGNPDALEINRYPELGVTASEWSLLKLIPEEHSRKINSFEVKLGNVENMQIGWIDEAHCKTSPSATNKVGKTASSLGLDLCDSGFWVASMWTKVNDISSSEGDTIRCEKDNTLGTYKWFINGDDIPFNSVSNLGGYKSRHASRIPAFSGKGQWWVTKVELSLS